ncbi:MAG: hypothetical protein IJ011_01815 [Clostridia bacterium]|nr:hypothetical protein [Clostridia bacterium]
MNKSKKLISFLLCAGILLTPALSACNGGSDREETKTETDSETEIETSNESYSNYLYSDRTMNYNIVYAADGNNDVKNAATLLYNKLSNYVDDKSFFGTDAEIEKGALPEILIGETDREDSRQVSESVAENTYVIKKVNGQIVILAAKAWMLSDAVEAFMEKIEFSKDRKTATLAEDIDVTYTYDGNTRERWSLELPAYEGGILAQKSYTSNYGLDTMKGTTPKNYKVSCAYETNAEEFAAYVQKLTNAGYTLEKVADNEGILSYWVTKGDMRMYMYLSKKVGEARFVLDKGEAVTEDEFSYVYEKQVGDTTTLYQYGFKMSDHGKNVFEYYRDENNNKIQNLETSNCGQLLIFKLADNTVMIIDGASHYMMPKTAMEGLDSFLHEITGVPAGEKVTVSNWLITHSHLDHFGGFARFLSNYHDSYDVERMSFNFNYKDSNMPTFFESFKEWYPDVKYYRPHTGETLKIADITIDILYTYEDSVSAESGDIILDTMPLAWGGNPAVDQNNSSITAKITFDGKTFLLTGDIAYVARDVLFANYSAETLKSDILQVSHHGLNHLPELYAMINPSISLYSQKKEAISKLNGGTQHIYNSVVESTQGGADNIYFAGNCTAGVSVAADGSFEVETRDVIGDIWDGKEVMYVYGQPEA